MILISTDKLKEGMVLAQTIHTSDNLVILKKGKKLNKKYLKRLIELGIYSVYIEEGFDKSLEITEVIKESTKLEALSLTKLIIDNVVFFNNEIASSVKQTVEKIVDELISDDNILMSLIDIRALDDYVFSHSVNVCVLSLIIAINLNYRREQLNELGVEAILHDIGKTKIPDNILNKPSALTKDEFQIIKKHTTLGYEILKAIDCISNNSKNIVLSHHERYDGQGYPNGAKKNNIHEYARIVSVADVYDALTSQRVYRMKTNPDLAINYLVVNSGSQFDPKIVDCFINNIPKYPLGIGIILNSGEKGYVLSIKKDNINKPIVRILYDKNGKYLTSPYEIDLAKSTEYFICNSTDDVIIA